MNGEVGTDVGGYREVEQVELANSVSSILNTATAGILCSGGQELDTLLRTQSAPHQRNAGLLPCVMGTPPTHNVVVRYAYTSERGNRASSGRW